MRQLPRTKLNSCSDAVLFPLRLQPDLDQAADGFGAGCALSFCPIHDLLHQSVGYPNAIKRLGTSGRTPSLFTFNGY
jgi:hypothetical protein